jgi:FlaA1/EpsC-like NDP-sugar epimerase
MNKFKLFSNERVGKMMIYMVTDMLFVNFSILAAISLWADGTISGRQAVSISQEIWLWYQGIAVAISLITIIIYASFGMYNNLWKYASIDELLKIFVSTTFLFIIIFLFDTYLYASKNFLVSQKRLLFVAWMINTIMFSFSRFGYRAVKRIFLLLSHVMTSKAGCSQVMIIGAGFSGYGVIRGMLNSKIRDKYPAIVIDNDPNKNNTNILGVRVLSGLDKIGELVSKYQIDEIVIALPSASKSELKKIFDQCTLTECILKIIPPISNINENNNAINKFRDVNITDLLFRDEVLLETDTINNYLHDKVVLVTGGAGSIGSELCRQIAVFAPKRIIIFDIYENTARFLLNELNLKYGFTLDVVIRIGSVRDVERLENVFEEFSPEVVFHAAAHKHVSIMEENPGEAIKNNVFGTFNVANCADKFNTERFVFISTDKAVNPTNVMGASKRITELLIQKMASTSKTKFMAVRFGNVLGSNGSVLHIFKQQIENGGPVTVTHPDVERYFMTITEASQLVLQAVAYGRTGNIFVLDMGASIKINDLALNLIKLSGYKPHVDIKITYIGLFQGEKLYEELILDEEKDTLQTTHHKKIFITKPYEMNYNLFEKQLEELRVISSESPKDIEACLESILPNYKKTAKKS